VDGPAWTDRTDEANGNMRKRYTDVAAETDFEIGELGCREYGREFGRKVREFYELETSNCVRLLLFECDGMISSSSEIRGS
jgi:hypothetical protein